MKGPGIRIDLDVRRLWKCPQCSREMKATGVVTSRLCPAGGCEGVWMKLVEPLRKPILRYSPPPQPPLPEESDEPGPGEAADASRLSRKQRREQAAASEPVTGESAATESPVAEPLPGESTVENSGAVMVPDTPVLESDSSAPVVATTEREQTAAEQAGSEPAMVSDVGPATGEAIVGEANPT
jgi:hypothetical protein